jgi:excisionase family DNA binding protein
LEEAVSDPARVIDLSVAALREIVREELRAMTSASAAEQREILTREQAADLLQVCPSVVIRYMKSAALPGFKVGAEWRFRRSELEQWLSDQAAKPRGHTVRHAKKLQAAKGAG